MNEVSVRARVWENGKKKWKSAEDKRESEREREKMF